MWSCYVLAKFINMMIDVVIINNVVFCYEGDQIKLQDVMEGLIQQFDFQLDLVFIVLVLLLDKVYNEMMKCVGLKYFGKDFYVLVNFVFYGYWI